jgi:hypothetical protein
MALPTQAQISAGIRYASGYVATGGALLVMVGVLPADKAHAIVDAAQSLLTDLQKTVSDFYVLAALVFPIVMGVIARYGYKSASPASQVASLKQAAPDKVAEVAEAVKEADPKTLVAATQSIPAAQVTVTDPRLASPGVTVVAAEKTS